MSKILVAYYSKTGNTKEMAQAIGQGIEEAKMTYDLVPIEKVEPAQLLDYAGYVFGSPVYYGMPAAAVVQLFDHSVTLHGRLAGRVGAAFATSANIGGGNETTCLAILQMMLVHGMIVVGAAQGDHYGPVAVGSPDPRSQAQCRAHGRRVGELVAKLSTV